MRLSVITPTVGRDSLRDTLASIAPQLRIGDEHIVVGDGPQPEAAAICSEFVVKYHDGPRSGTWGTAQRDYGISIARGDWLLFCDDDDVFAPGALDAVRRVVGDNPTTPHIFRMQRTRWDDVLWADPVVREGNVGTPMIVTPRYDDMPLWVDNMHAYTADHRFAKRITDAHGVVWREEVLCIVR